MSVGAEAGAGAGPEVGRGLAASMVIMCGLGLIGVVKTLIAMIL